MNNIEFDKQHLWHPYTSSIAPLPCYEVVAANGAKITLADGTELVEGMSSWWACIHGYNHPVLNQAAKTQIDTFSHVMFGGLTHEPAIRLSKQLLDIVPSGLEHIFYADSGSVSIEVAIKMAIQYWACQGRSEKAKLVTPRGGYHGDTFAAMSVCDPVNGMHSLFKKTLIQHYFAPAPQTPFANVWNPDEIAPMRDIFEQHHQSIAALILEPIVQGAGGMRLYHPEYLRACRQLCDEFDVLLICDEIATGFARTGEMFACHHAAVSPDIMCIGKGLSGGYLTLAATLCTQQVAYGVCEGEPGVFMHGPTFMANPLATAIASASVELLRASDWRTNIGRIQTSLEQGLKHLIHYPSVADVRILGAIGVVEMKKPVDVAALQAVFIQHGAWIRPFSKLIYIMPPYVCSDDELSLLCHAIDAGIKTCF